MKKVITILFVIGLALLFHLQVEARRILEQVKTEKTDNPLQSNVPGRKLDAVYNAAAAAANDIKPNESSTYGNPLTGSVPAVDANKGIPANNNSGSTSDDEANSSYRNYGNPSGSSTETHHVYTNDCDPRKSC